MQTLQKFPQDKLKIRKNALFFFRELQLISDFKLEEEVLKFIYVFVSWSFPETDLETNFFRLGKSKSWEGQIWSAESLTFQEMFDIPLPINLFITSVNLRSID